jgi:hypothetical protein
MACAYLYTHMSTYIVYIYIYTHTLYIYTHTGGYQYDEGWNDSQKGQHAGQAWEDTDTAAPVSTGLEHLSDRYLYASAQIVSPKCVYVCVCVYIYIYIYIYIHMHINIYTHIHIDVHTYCIHTQRAHGAP